MERITLKFESVLQSEYDGALDLESWLPSLAPSLGLESSGYEQHYTYQTADLDVLLDAPTCSPPTPISTLNGYESQARSFYGQFSSIISALGPRDLHMETFAKTLNRLIAFLRSIPSLCIGDSNRAAFKSAQNAIDRTTRIASSGIAKFESNLSGFEKATTPLFEAIRKKSTSITSSSRDFRPVTNAAQRAQAHIATYNISIWNLSNRIKQIAGRIQQSQEDTGIAFRQALAQIELNVVAESEKFEAARQATERAQHHWRDVDGKVGFERYSTLFDNVKQVLAPNFATFLRNVPTTPRVETAARNAEKSFDAILAAAAAFPRYKLLPGASSEFPYNTYGRAARKFGKVEIHTILKYCCVNYHKQFSKFLYIGDLSYERGGKAKPHKSHRNGLDADVDPVEVGNVGDAGFNATKALAAAKIFLKSGADLIFYGDQATVDAANGWAKKNGLKAKLQFEASHKRHFHLRKDT